MFDSTSTASDFQWISGFVVGFLDFALRVTAAIVVMLRRGGRSEQAAPWMVLVLAVPFFGIVLYLLLGETSFGRLRKKRYEAALRRIKEACPSARGTQVDLTAIDQHDAQVSAAALSLDAAPIAIENSLEITGDPDVMDGWMLHAIDEATLSIEVVSYIFEDDRAGRAIGEALCRAHTRGVECRILVDGFGSSRFLRSPLCARIRTAGVALHEALPGGVIRSLFHRIDLRNHRKIMIVDDRLGFTGSRNIVAPEFLAKKAYAPWVDCCLRIRGPAVSDLRRVLAVDWLFETGELLERLDETAPAAGSSMLQILPTGPVYDSEAVVQTLHAAVQVARKEIVLTTPYFVPDAPFLRALEVAARRGVSIHLVIPARNDSRLVALASRALLGPLLDAGVHVHEFQHGLLHAKTVTVDGAFSVITSANLDRRSFQLNFEITTVVFDDGSTQAVRRVQQRWMEESTPLALSAWEARTCLDRIKEGLAGLLSPLL
ncbi:MAG: cardiolipin synthase [Planctomycetota bacterium]|nr:cardiolipin synthase [Planctomycetota bacterium]